MQKRYFLLEYTGSPHYIEARKPYRKEHLDLAWKFADQGDLILGGAYEEPADGALLVWFCEDPKPILNFIENDPYVKNGVVQSWKIRKWTAVVGEHCKTPIRTKDL